MTRFARSKGSKSSNERIPEQATPWEVMAQQLKQKQSQPSDAKEKAEFEAKRKENYENFLKEEKEKSVVKTWCEFDEPANESDPAKKSKNSKKKEKRNKDTTKLTSNTPEEKKVSKSKKSEDESQFNADDPELTKWCEEYSDEDTNKQYALLTSQLEKLCDKPKSAKKRNKKLSAGEEELKPVEEPEHVPAPTKKLKRKRKSDTEITTEAEPKVKKEKQTTSLEQNHDEEQITKEQVDGQPDKKKKKKNKRKKDKKNGNKTEEIVNTSEKVIPEVTKPKNEFKKPAKKEHARRKPVVTEKTTIIVNGEELEVSSYDGFPILAKEAERLVQLRKSLISKGIPRSEVERTMKLERRKAEKALARMKKKLCFHCRRGGHNLSECPELNKEGAVKGLPSTGLCFKCGSTEHTHFACKVVRNQEYKFAQCFICKEQGHISRQCPDNPRGLYPKGGGCRECGDVTHLKKDCPKIVQKREDESMRLETLADDNVEDIEKPAAAPSKTKSTIKHVQF